MHQHTVLKTVLKIDSFLNSQHGGCGNCFLQWILSYAVKEPSGLYLRSLQRASQTGSNAISFSFPVSVPLSLCGIGSSWQALAEPHVCVGIDAPVPWWHGWGWRWGCRSRSWDWYRDGPAVVALIGVDVGGGCSVGCGWLDGVDGRWRWGRAGLSVQPQVFVLLAEPVQLHFKLFNAPPLSFQKLLLALDDVVELQ